MSEEIKRQRNQQDSGDQRQEVGQKQNQKKSDTQRRAEEAARRDEPKGGASSVGTVGT